MTNNLTQSKADDVQEVCAIRWKIEEFHRELKQLTGIEVLNVNYFGFFRAFGDRDGGVRQRAEEGM